MGILSSSEALQNPEKHPELEENEAKMYAQHPWKPLVYMVNLLN